MPTNLPPLSPQLPFIYKLDQKDTAISDLITFNKTHISMVILGKPPKSDLIYPLINAFCSEPTTDNRLRALVIEEGEIYDAMKEDLERLLKGTFPTEPVEQIRAFTTSANSETPLEFLRKGPITFNGLTIKMALNNAIINSEDSSD